MPAVNQEPQLVDRFSITGGDYASAGTVSIMVKNILKEAGFDAVNTRRAAIASFEAELNVVMYGGGGHLELYLAPAKVRIQVIDQGPGIADLALAMQEGWSTATPEMRELGFGAGMGLPNMKKNTDLLSIDTAAGKGTKVLMEIEVHNGGA